MTREVVCPPGLRDRLDKALSALLPDLSRGAARRLIAAGAVFVDGRRCRVGSRLVVAGSRLRVQSALSLEAVPTLPILYDEPGWVAIHKPAGMPSAPTRRAAAGTAADELTRQLRSGGRREQIRVVHRLDASTSGVLLFATTPAAAAYLSDLFRTGAVQKTYVAMIAGNPAADQGAITLPIRTVGARARVDTSGSPAHTEWKVLRRHGAVTLVELQPTSGRMHQLRVHLHALGHPVLGDRWYGGPPAPRLMLHAAGLRLPHPQTRATVNIEAPWPPGFE